MKKLKNGIIRVPDDGDYLSDVERASDSMTGEVRRVNRKAMRQESRGGERSVSRCGDGDVVGVGEGGGGGFGERRKSGRKRGKHAFVEYMVQREHH